MLLHEGRLVHEWRRDEPASLRAADGGLEAALAAQVAASG